jgi:cold shock CspA family protein
MAKSKESFNKKDKEQRRFKQKQDKKQKMEDRKAHKKKTGSLEDMMAYVDDNGNLSDTPPDPRQKRIFKQEDIQIGVPKHEDLPDVLNTGTVTFFNTSKGFGFISDTLTNERLFFHVKDTQELLQEMDKVQFRVERGPRGLSAVQVTRLP